MEKKSKIEEFFVEENSEDENLFNLLPLEIILEITAYLTFKEICNLRCVSKSWLEMTDFYIKLMPKENKCKFLNGIVVTFKTMPYIHRLAASDCLQASYILGCYYFRKNRYYEAWLYLTEYFREKGTPYLWSDLCLAFVDTMYMRVEYRGENCEPNENNLGSNSPELHKGEIFRKNTILYNTVNYGPNDEPFVDEIYVIFYIHSANCYHLRAVIFEKTLNYEIYLTDAIVKRIYEVIMLKYFGHSNITGCNFIISSDGCSSLRYNITHEYSIDLPNWNSKDHLPIIEHPFDLKWAPSE